jgi:hypothetical protein
MKSRTIQALAGMILGLFFLAAPVFGAGAEPPASVRIDSLSHLYDGVDFDHELHVDIAENCSVCHHHRFGGEIVDKQCARCHSDSKKIFAIACGDCHVKEPFSGKHIRKMEANPNRYHLDVTGLKGAYHLRCFNCHIKTGAPAECGDCHARTDAGDRFYDSGKYAPKGGGSAGSHE